MIAHEWVGLWTDAEVKVAQRAVQQDRGRPLTNWPPPDPASRYSSAFCWLRGHPPVSADCWACFQAATAAWNRRHLFHDRVAS